jgi:8-oxo-dGTP diphosphatase
MQRAHTRQVFHGYTATAAGGSGTPPYCPRCAAACTPAFVGGRMRSRCPHCGHVHFRNPLPGVAIVIRQRRQVLLGRRAAHASLAGQWALPAGFIEFDEDFLSAARREAREETGLEIAVTGILNVTTNFLSERLHALVVAVAARRIGGALQAGDDFCEVRWVSLEAPLPPLAYEADGNLLAALQAGSTRLLPVEGRDALP